MLIIQHFAHDYFSHKLDENYIGLTFNIKGKYEGTMELFPSDQPNIIIQEGFICIKKLDLTVEGNNFTSSFSKNLDIKFNEIKKISFDKKEVSEDFQINVPQGNYRKLSFGIELTDFLRQPAVMINAAYYSLGKELVPLHIELLGINPRFEQALDTRNQNPANDGDNPSFIFEINASKWLENLTFEDLENASLTNDCILINPTHNPKLYKIIANQIMHNQTVKLEPK
jgi:hypothetical protein